MTKDICYAVSQVKTVVPAVQPAWVRLVLTVDFKDGEPGIWDDRILPVLAYGVATAGGKWEAAGVYLVADDLDGPQWLDSRTPRGGYIFLSIGAKPVAGEPVDGVTDGMKHERMDDMLCDFNYLFE